jgi:hypothetical protein
MTMTLGGRVPFLQWNELGSKSACAGALLGLRGNSKACGDWLFRFGGGQGDDLIQWIDPECAVAMALEGVSSVPFRVPLLTG